ncbi:hypothetical protein ACFFJB_02030 [Camelimonas abortus]|uniref:hypothetical protein n=1 Tax=Camelimonas abortus TaxID=1017184 RepID=UPI0035E4D5F8
MALFSGSSQRRLAMWQIGEAQKERERNDALIAEARGQALNEIGSGVDQAVPYYTGAIDRFQPWVQSGLDAVGQYNTTLGDIGAANDQYRARQDDIYGYGGAEGTARARAAFNSSPGYEYQRDQAIDAVARKQSAMGMLGRQHRATWTVATSGPWNTGIG